MTQTILITGATDGIGLQIARQSAAAGAKTILVARDAAKLKSVAASLEGPNRPEIAVVDLTDSIQIDTFLADLDGRRIVPDVLVNNAGQGASGAFVGNDWQKLEALLRVNVAALAQLTHWGAQRMKARGRGAIVNLSAAVATRPTPFFAAYAASKAFVTSLSLATDKELRRHGVTVSVVHPPAVRTSFADAGKADLRSTLVLKLFPSVSAASVARAVLRVARTRRRSTVVGPIAAIIMATAPIMPRAFDLAFMSLLFKGRRAPAAMNVQPGK